jgi:YidC/Oxa1 family membrane protein insertase
MEEERKLDKNQIIGFVIIGILLIGFSWWNSKNAQEQVIAEPAIEQVEESSSTQEGLEQVFEEENSNPQSEVVAAPSDSLEALYAEKTYKIENDLLEITMLGKGAQFKNVHLKEFQTYDSLPLQIIDENVLQNFSVGSDINSADKIYSGRIETTDSSQTLYLTTNTNEGELTLWYRLRNGNYQLEAGISGKDLAIQNGSELGFKYAQDAIRMEKSRKNELRTTTIYYWEAADQDYDYLSLTSSDDEEEVSNVKWFGHKQQFFSTIIEANSGYAKTRVGQAELTDEEFTKRMATAAVFNDKVGTDFSVNYSIYFGPNDYSILKSYAASGYNQIIDFGWGIFGWISRYVVIPTFNWLDGYGINYGIIILIMALMIKVVLFPLTYQSYKSMAKMRVLKPEMDALNEKHKNADAMVKQQATMALYKEAGVNPLGGCIPQLVQLPILIAMFRFFPASIELRQKSFLWATDLSTYDDVITWTGDIPLISSILGNHLSIFTLLMAISTLMYTMMNQSMTASNSQMPQMKYIMYAMPVMMFFWFNSYASGLSYYYLVANVITFTQQWIIRKTVDDEAIHAKLKANKDKPKKKKSKFQEQLEEMSKKQGRRGIRQAKK